MQFIHWRYIDARPGVDDESAVGRVLNGVIAVARRQPHQSTAIEIHAAIMNQIRVLIRINAARAKPHHPVRLVDAVDAAHDPFAAGDGILQFARVRIDQIQVPPAVAFGGVDDFIGLLQPVHQGKVQVLGVGGPDECAGSFVDEVAHGSRA